MAAIKLITEEGFIPDLKKDIHYITWTPRTQMPMRYNDTLVPYSGLSYPYAIIGKTIGDPIPFFLNVDSACETGTLYPAANITIMPSGIFDDETIYRYFHDAVKAQQMIRARNVVFDYTFFTYVAPHTLRSDNYEYFKMIEYNAHRFDLAEGPATIYIMAMENNDMVRCVRGRYGSEEYFATPAEISLLA